MRIFALIISAVGLLLFGGLLATSFAEPIAVERLARNLINAEVEKRVTQRVEVFDHSAFGQWFKRNQPDAVRLTEEIAKGLPQRISTELADMQKADCECRKAIRQLVGDAFVDRFTFLTSLNDRLSALIRNQYVETTAKLMREFRIFTGANALVFLLLGFATLARPRAGVHLLLPMIVLLGGAAVTGYFYLFQQDWLRTILYSDYVGWWYLPWLGFAIAWLADITFNRGRVTVRVLDGLGGGVSAIPC